MFKYFIIQKFDSLQRLLYVPVEVTFVPTCRNDFIFCQSQRQKSEGMLSSASIDQDIAPWFQQKSGKSSAKSGHDSSTSPSDMDDVDDQRPPPTSKSSFRTKSERLQSEMSKFTDPNEADEEFEAVDDEMRLETDDSRISRKTSLKSRSMSKGELQIDTEDTGLDRSRSHRSSRKMSRGETLDSHRSSRRGSRGEVLTRRGSRGEMLDSHRSSRRDSNGEIIALDEEDEAGSRSTRKLSRRSRSQLDPNSREYTEAEEGQRSHRSSLRQSRSKSHLDPSSREYSEVEESSRSSHRTPRGRKQSNFDPTNRDRMKPVTRMSSYHDGSLSRHVTQEEEELMEMLSHEDDNYSDDFEDDEHARLFDDNMASRVRSEPVGSDEYKSYQSSNQFSAPAHLSVRFTAAHCHHPPSNPVIYVK